MQGRGILMTLTELRQTMVWQHPGDWLCGHRRRTGAESPRRSPFPIIAGVDPRWAFYASFSDAVLTAFAAATPDDLRRTAATRRADDTLVPGPKRAEYLLAATGWQD